MGKYIVFGGDGFVGHYLIKELLQRGENVLACDMVQTANIYENCDFQQVDITNTDELKKVKMSSDDIVIHLAARQYHLPVPREGRNEFFFEVNYQGTANILAEMAKKGCCRMIYFSTDMTYGKPQYLPVDVYHPQKPFGPYGGSKKASEDLCRQYRQKGFHITIFRPRMILGPGRLGILKKLFKLIELNLPVPMIGNGKNCYQMISVFDCVSAILKACEKGIPDREYNLGSLNPPTVHDLLAGVIKNVGSKSILLSTNGTLVKKCLALLGNMGIELLYKEQYEIADENYLLDIGHTMKDLDWQPKFDDTDMLYKAYEYYHQEKAGKKV